MGFLPLRECILCIIGDGTTLVKEKLVDSLAKLALSLQTNPHIHRLSQCYLCWRLIYELLLHIVQLGDGQAVIG